LLLGSDRADKMSWFPGECKSLTALVHCIDAERNSRCHTFLSTAGSIFYIQISSLQADNKLRTKAPLRLPKALHNSGELTPILAPA